MDVSALHRRLIDWKNHDLRLGRESALAELNHVLAALPDDAGLIMFAAQFLCLHHVFDACVPLAERAAASGDPQLRLALAQVYYQARRPAEARGVLMQLIAIHGEAPALLIELGVACQAMGDGAGARDALDRAIALDPASAAALHERVLVDKVQPGDAAIGKLEALSRNTFGRRPQDVVRIWYGLGKAFDDIGEHRRAFGAFANGAQAFRSYRPVNQAALARSHQAAERLFESPLPPSPEAPPRGFIFIVGMPRSGTTMTEQIALGDDRTASAGETAAFSESVTFALRDALQGEAVSTAHLNELRANYLLRLRDYGVSAAPVIIDKTPTNWLFAPLAAVALGARIVHCRRDVMDNCWSLYTTWFGEGTAWSYDFDAIAQSYARYAQTAARWADLVGEAVLELQYEAMVQQPDAATAALFKHCGLEWRAEVLDFHAQPQTVITPSMAQVRRPVHTNSVRRVAPYLPMLEPLIDALRRNGVQLSL